MGKKRVPPEVQEFFRSLGKKYGPEGGRIASEKLREQGRLSERGEKGGKTAAENMTAKQRKERARKAALAMHKKNKHNIKSE